MPHREGGGILRPSAPQAAGALGQPQPQDLPIFQSQVQAPAQIQSPKGSEELGFLGNAGNIIQLLGTLGGDPSIAGFGQGLLGLQKQLQQKELQKESTKAANVQAQRKFQTSERRAKSAFDQANKDVQAGRLDLVTAENIQRLLQQGQPDQAKKIRQEGLKFSRSIEKFKTQETFKADQKGVQEKLPRILQLIASGVSPRDATNAVFGKDSKGASRFFPVIENAIKNRTPEQAEASISESLFGGIGGALTGQISPQTQQSARPRSQIVEARIQQLKENLGPNETIMQHSDGREFVVDTSTGEVIRPAKAQTGGP